MTKKRFTLSIAMLLTLAIAIIFSFDQYQKSKSITYNDIKKIKLSKQARIRELQKYFDGLRIPFGGEKSGYPANYLLTEYEKVKKNSTRFKSSFPPVEWVQRGPANVGGRTRGLIVDPDDATHNTWFAGTATGGVWKTTDGGENWDCLTNDIPYQATTTLAMALSNTDIIYMGTGESFPGSIYTTGGGIFKSTNKGESWEHLASTANNDDFRYVNRIIVSPTNENIVLAATSSGILKSIDGGTTWEMTYSGGNVEDITADTSDFENMYAGVNSRGIIRSTDEGSNWIPANNGFGAGRERIELAVSPVNTNIIYASVSKSDGTASLFYSNDKALGWHHLTDIDENDYDYLGGQGMYDNTITAHPYYDSIVFWGGVNLWKAHITETIETGSGEVTDFYSEGTDSFLSFTPFTGNLYPGMNTGNNEGAIDITEADFVSVEIRFGAGVSQKAHRFFVPEGATAGVPASSYTYQDYVDVPFQVWDIENNRQLMCSFRDQERDGAFNLYERTGENYGQLGREYLFINAIEYDSLAPNSNIAVQGGRSYKMIYFFWPTLTENSTWEPENLPESKLVIQYAILQNRMAQIVNVSDSYNRFGGKNNYDQSAGMGKQSIPGLHPDHHGLKIIPTNPSGKEFWILNSNDGGLAISKNNGETFTQIKNNIITTQFYGVSKKPYRNEYIGGMQDNGTWQSPSNEDAGLSEGYFFRLGGDGFETVWNTKDSNKIMGSIYNNAIYRSLDHGLTWESATLGIPEGDGPFITHLTMVPSNPGKVFAVGAHGLYYTVNFGNTAWWKEELGEGWLGTNGTLSSSHNVEVSIANDSIIYAGAAMNEETGLKIFVSEDQGKNFEEVNVPQFDMPYFISGIETHPVNSSEAFVLYGAAQKPKILRTYDKGQTWEDMSGFGFESTSSNGFPDVGCYSLFVFPDDTSRIWAGTEIGIMESSDNGISWHYLESELPSVTIYQMFMQNNQLVVSTYGRGIWTYQYKESDKPTGIENGKTDDHSEISIYPNPANDLITVELNNDLSGKNLQMQMYSSDGKLMLSNFYKESSGKIYLNLTDYPEGNYILRILTENKNIVIKKLIISK